jgi:hypothetical protein
MRWQSVAQEVISNLESRNIIDLPSKNQSLELVSGCNPEEAFRTVYQDVIPEWRIGWNKIWRGNDLIGWYGSTLTIQPLRAVAFEIESKSDAGDEVRNYLSKLYKTTGSIYTGVEKVQNSQLAEYGFEPAKTDFNTSKLHLLQRLNLNQRDKPGIERWRWSKNNGLGYTTDDGRFQVTRDLVWARAIETGINSANGMSNPLREFLLGLSNENREALLEDVPDDVGLESCLEKLVFYGFAHLMIGSVRFSGFPGKFPQNAVQIWG